MENEKACPSQPNYSKISSERASYNGSIEASQASDVGSIPIARSNKISVASILCL
jgi:hypothetical protein